MLKCDFKKAKKIIQAKSDLIDKADMGLKEDWFWTAGPVFEDGSFTFNLDNPEEFTGYDHSTWATPVLYLSYKDGREEFIDCYIDDGALKQ